MFKVIEVVNGLFKELCSTDDFVMAKSIADTGRSTFVSTKEGCIYAPKRFNSSATTGKNSRNWLFAA